MGNVTGIFHGILGYTTNMISECVCWTWSTDGDSDGDDMVILMVILIWWLYGDYMVIIWWLYGDYMVIIWWLYGDSYMVILMVIIWWLLYGDSDGDSDGDDMVIIWWFWWWLCNYDLKYETLFTSLYGHFNLGKFHGSTVEKKCECPMFRPRAVAGGGTIICYQQIRKRTTESFAVSTGPFFDICKYTYQE